MDEFSKAAVSVKGDDEAFGRFALEKKTFIMSCASRSLHRFINDSDDEWSVALIAFHEAVRTFEPEKGNFSAFASTVIKRRLLDEERRKLSYSNVEVPVMPELLSGETPDEEEESAGGRIASEIKRSGNAGEADTVGSTPLQDEIASMQEVLGAYGFSFFDLTECSPRSSKTKDACIRAVQMILSDAELWRRMQKGRNLPMKELCGGTGLARKLLDRHRRYIIAVAEILKGDYPLLREYIKGMME